MHKKIAGKIHIGLIVAGIAMVVFLPTAIYLNFQIRKLVIMNSGEMVPFPSEDPFIFLGFLIGFFYLGLGSVILSLIFGILYAIVEIMWEIFTKKVINKLNRIYLLIFFVALLLCSVSPMYSFVLHTIETDTLIEKKAQEYGIKNNLLNLSAKQSREIYSMKLKSYGPSNYKNYLHEYHPGGKEKSEFLWGKDEFSIFFRNFKEIVMTNLTQNTTNYYSISKFYPYINNISLDIFEIPESDPQSNNQEKESYLFIRADLRIKPYRSVFLAFNKNGELLYEELANGLDN